MAGTTQYFGISYPSSTDLVKDGAANMQTIATGFDSAVAIPTYNNQTGTTYTFVLLDAAKVVTASNASSSTYTIPPQSSVVWTTGATLRVSNLGAGVVTFAGGVGVTVTNTNQTLAQYQSASLVRTGTDAWTVLPDSGTASGMTLIKTQTIGTTVSSVNVTGAFSTTYDNYKIIINGGVGSATAVLSLKLGASATGYYGGFAGVAYVGGASNANYSNSTAFGSAGYGTANYLQSLVELQSPFLAKYTMMQALTVDPAQSLLGTGYHAVATSYTDFTFTPSSGTLTGGTIYVYGYNK